MRYPSLIKQAVMFFQCASCSASFHVRARDTAMWPFCSMHFLKILLIRRFYLCRETLLSQIMNFSYVCLTSCFKKKGKLFNKNTALVSACCCQSRYCHQILCLASEKTFHNLVMQGRTASRTLEKPHKINLCKE